MSLDEVKALVIDKYKEEELPRLLHILKDLESVTKALKNSRCGLAEARLLFDCIIKRHCATHLLLEKRSSLVENTKFENDVSKVEGRSEKALEVQCKRPYSFC